MNRVNKMDYAEVDKNDPDCEQERRSRGSERLRVIGVAEDDSTKSTYCFCLKREKRQKL